MDEELDPPVDLDAGPLVCILCDARSLGDAEGGVPCWTSPAISRCSANAVGRSSSGTTSRSSGAADA